MKKFRFTYFDQTTWRGAKIVIRAMTKQKAIEKFKENYSKDYSRIIELKDEK